MRDAKYSCKTGVNKLIVKLGKISIADWSKTRDQTWYRSAGVGGDLADAIYIFKITHNASGYKEYVPGFFGKLEFLKDQYKTMYGDKRFGTLHEVKDNVDVFLNRVNNLKAFL